MLDFIELDIKKTQFYQDVVSENKQEWITKGREQGELDLILRLCKHRYGKLNAKIIQQLETLSLKQRDKLALLLLDYPDGFGIDKFKAWLQTQLNP